MEKITENKLQFILADEDSPPLSNSSSQATASVAKGAGLGR